MIPLSKPNIGKEESEHVLEVLESGWLTTGPVVKQFEENFTKYCNCKYASAVSSGTTALDVALNASGIKRGDEVILPSLTFVATANAILMQGAKPVFVDIKKNEYNIDPDMIKKAITKKTKAIIPVHYAGQSCDMKSINKIAKEYNLKIIEDACHAHGAKYSNGKIIGNSKNLVCFSFHPMKNMTTGEGGMVVSNNKSMIEKINLLRNHCGQVSAIKRFKNKLFNRKFSGIGYNYRMSDINAAIGIEQLKRLESNNNIRKYLANQYSNKLKDLQEIIVPIFNDDCVYHLYTIQADNRLQLMEYLKNNGITTGIYYNPVHLEPYITGLGYGNEKLPNTEFVCKKIVSIPMYPGLSIMNLEYIIKTIKKYYGDK